MTIAPGTYALEPPDARLMIRTSRQGAASKAGHDLLIEVQTWGATVQLAPDPAQSVFELNADSRSLKVLEGTGGIKALGDDDRGSIVKTINKEILKGAPITFRSTAVRPDGEGRFHVTGDLELANGISLIAFDITVTDDGRLTGSATVRQTEWGIKPYSALFGTLKVADEVQIEVEGVLKPAP
ncbi:MAG TPA: YceI family protein [Solirubrobacteraceae bacterium]|jgi:polyisoprenoid-binding protein YceI|nr:YceI family protein [Solirubrobacteraceae bacterium]